MPTYLPGLSAVAAATAASDAGGDKHDGCVSPWACGKGWRGGRMAIPIARDDDESPSPAPAPAPRPLSQEGQILSNDPWSIAYDKLRKMGWRWFEGSGLVSFVYIHPNWSGKKKTEVLKHGVKGTDYFTSLEAIQEYARTKHGWNGGDGRGNAAVSPSFLSRAASRRGDVSCRETVASQIKRRRDSSGGGSKRNSDNHGNKRRATEAGSDILKGEPPMAVSPGVLVEDLVEVGSANVGGPCTTPSTAQRSHPEVGRGGNLSEGSVATFKGTLQDCARAARGRGGGRAAAITPSYPEAPANAISTGQDSDDRADRRRNSHVGTSNDITTIFAGPVLCNKRERQSCIRTRRRLRGEVSGAGALVVGLVEAPRIEKSEPTVDSVSYATTTSPALRFQRAKTRSRSAVVPAAGRGQGKELIRGSGGHRHEGLGLGKDEPARRTRDSASAQGCGAEAARQKGRFDAAAVRPITGSTLNDGHQLVLRRRKPRRISCPPKSSLKTQRLSRCCARCQKRGVNTYCLCNKEKGMCKECFPIHAASSTEASRRKGRKEMTHKAPGQEIKQKQGPEEPPGRSSQRRVGDDGASTRTMGAGVGKERLPRKVANFRMPSGRAPTATKPTLFKSTRARRNYESHSNNSNPSNSSFGDNTRDIDDDSDDDDELVSFGGRKLKRKAISDQPNSDTTDSDVDTVASPSGDQDKITLEAAEKYYDIAVLKWEASRKVQKECEAAMRRCEAALRRAIIDVEMDAAEKKKARRYLDRVQHNRRVTENTKNKHNAMGRENKVTTSTKKIRTTKRRRAIAHALDSKAITNPSPPSINDTPSSASALPKSSALPNDEEDGEYAVMSSMAAWDVLTKKFGFRYLDGRYCLPGTKKARMEKDALPENGHFAALSDLRKDLCAYGLLPLKKTARLNENQRLDIRNWVRYANIAALRHEPATVPHFEGLTSREAWMKLVKLGFRYSDGKYVLPGVSLKSKTVVAGRDFFVYLEDLCKHLARFGMPAAATTHELGQIDLLKVQLYIASCPNVDTYTRIEMGCTAKEPLQNNLKGDSCLPSETRRTSRLGGNNSSARTSAAAANNSDGGNFLSPAEVIEYQRRLGRKGKELHGGLRSRYKTCTGIDTAGFASSTSTTSTLPVGNKAQTSEVGEVRGETTPVDHRSQTQDHRPPPRLMADEMPSSSLRSYADAATNEKPKKCCRHVNADGTKNGEAIRCEALMGTASLQASKPASWDGASDTIGRSGKESKADSFPTGDSGELPNSVGVKTESDTDDNTAWEAEETDDEEDYKVGKS